MHPVHGGGERCSRQDLQLDQLPAVCMPNNEVVDKYATKIAKIKRDHRIDKAMPFVEIAVFLPDWADDVCGERWRNIALRLHLILFAIAGGSRGR